jgi:hypothetical protein
MSVAGVRVLIYTVWVWIVGGLMLWLVVEGLSVCLFLINISNMGLCVSVNVSFICSPFL